MLIGPDFHARNPTSQTIGSQIAEIHVKIGEFFGRCELNSYSRMTDLAKCNINLHLRLECLLIAITAIQNNTTNR